MHPNKLADLIKQVIPSLSLSSALVSLQKVSCCLHVTTEKFTQLVQNETQQKTHTISPFNFLSNMFPVDLYDRNQSSVSDLVSFFLLFCASKNSMNTKFTQLGFLHSCCFTTHWGLNPLMWLPGIHEILGHRVLRVLQHSLISKIRITVIQITCAKYTFQ